MTLPSGAFNFWTTGEMNLLWSYLWWALSQAAPVLEIFMAAFSAYLVIRILIGVVSGDSPLDAVRGVFSREDDGEDEEDYQ